MNISEIFIQLKKGFEYSNTDISLVENFFLNTTNDEVSLWLHIHFSAH